ncbi:hypothetical protein RJ640_023223 [Escallonia rubra]|uniref:Protein kinase domain-containing protein n=1 Tax=Escallonia rubra TaxID=112253 RepID=A0AA88R6M0_9ASTE|nr:hypothetical protein RJ640_023223 [Escallonia rubra]
MAAISLYHFLLLTLFPTLGGASRDACKVARCSHKGPLIGFPFRLNFLQPEHCGYPGFTLTCNPNNQTVLRLPSSVNLLVKKIDYGLQTVQLQDPNSCLPKQLPNLNLSDSPFEFTGYSESLYNLSLFNCSPPERSLGGLIPCLSVGGYRVYAINHFGSTSDLMFCVKIGGISSVPYDLLDGVDHQKRLHLNWSEPSCEVCEAQGKTCGFKNYTSPVTVATQCLDIRKTTKGASKKLILIAVLVLGAIFLALIGTTLYYAHASHTKRNEDQIRIDKFLEDYKALKPTRYSFADIKKITNQFKNKLGEGGYGTVFKGKLSSEVFVAVKVLNDSTGNGDEFINEVGTMARIHHVNVVRLVGFCADGTRRALVYEFLPNDSLEKCIFCDNQNSNTLGWEKLQDIALGIAKGLEYLHQGCDRRILHFDIKPHNILLDHNFNPKVADFGLAKLCSKEQSMVSMTAARGTMGYIAPEVFSRNFGNVSYKSDVYSFKMMLLETFGGRKNIDATVQNTSQAYIPEWVYNRLCEGEELCIKAKEEEHGLIAKRLTVVGLWVSLGRYSDKHIGQVLSSGLGRRRLSPRIVFGYDSMHRGKCVGSRIILLGVTVAECLEALDIPKTTKGASKKLILIAVLVLGAIFLTLIGAALYYAYASHRKQNEDQIRIDSNTPSWEKLQDIALGIAKGIEYFHRGCNHRILHFDIKPHNILLDHNFNPKVADFGLTKFFGMMLLEMVGGRKNSDVTVQNTSQAYFPEWVYNRLCEGEEIGIRVEEEKHGRIAKRLAVVGLWCIQWYPMSRPSMKTVVQMLEGKGDILSIPPNPFDSTKPARALDNELPIISEAE